MDSNLIGVYVIVSIVLVVTFIAMVIDRVLYYIKHKKFYVPWK